MPYLSAFTPCGLLHMSSETPTAEVLYDQMIAGYGGQRDTSQGSRNEAYAYAAALTQAAALEHIERAGDERLPSRTVGMLEVHEATRGIVPKPGATIRERRAELERRWQLPRGAKRIAVEDGLRAILGDHFVRYQVQDISGFIPRVPASIGDWPMNLQRSNVVRKVVRLTSPVAFINTQVTAGYEIVLGSQLIAGDEVVFDIGHHGLMDRVTIVDAADLDDSLVLAATFQSTHSSGVIGMTGTMPYWMNLRRRVRVVVDAFAANDRELRRRVDEFMARTMRAVTTWTIVEGDGASFEAFRIGEPSIGRRVLKA